MRKLDQGQFEDLDIALAELAEGHSDPLAREAFAVLHEKLTNNETAVRLYNAWNSEPPAHHREANLNR